MANVNIHTQGIIPNSLFILQKFHSIYTPLTTGTEILKSTFFRHFSSLLGEEGKLGRGGRREKNRKKEKKEGRREKNSSFALDT